MAAAAMVQRGKGPAKTWDHAMQGVQALGKEFSVVSH